MFYVFFIRWWTLPTGSGSYLNPAFPLVRLMIISESSHDHLGASCSNIVRIRTKENIAVDTHLIGILPNPLGGFLIIFESQLNPFRFDMDRMRISVIKQILWSLGGFLFKHRSYSNQKEHSCRYPLDGHIAKPTWGLLDQIWIIA